MPSIAFDDKALTEFDFVRGDLLFKSARITFDFYDPLFNTDIIFSRKSSSPNSTDTRRDPFARNIHDRRARAAFSNTSCPHINAVDFFHQSHDIRVDEIFCYRFFQIGLNGVGSQAFSNAFAI